MKSLNQARKELGLEQEKLLDQKMIVSGNTVRSELVIAGLGLLLLLLAIASN